MWSTRLSPSRSLASSLNPMRPRSAKIKIRPGEVSEDGVRESLAFDRHRTTQRNLKFRRVLEIVSSGLFAFWVLLAFEARGGDGADSAVPIRIGWQIAPGVVASPAWPNRTGALRHRASGGRYRLPVCPHWDSSMCSPELPAPWQCVARSSHRRVLCVVVQPCGVPVVGSGDVLSRVCARTSACVPTGHHTSSHYDTQIVHRGYWLTPLSVQ